MELEQIYEKAGFTSEGTPVEPKTPVEPEVKTNEGELNEIQENANESNQEVTQETGESETSEEGQSERELLETLSDEDLERLIDKLTEKGGKRGLVEIPASVMAKVRAAKREAANRAAEEAKRASQYEGQSKQQLEIVKALLDKFNPNQKQEEYVAPTIPDPVLEPEDYARYIAEQADKKVQTVTERLEQYEKREIVARAHQGLQILEQEQTKAVPEYPEYKNAYIDLQVKQLKRFNPQAPENQLRGMVEEQFLQQSAQYAAFGQDPTALLVEYMKDAGYQPKSKQPPKPIVNKPDLDALADTMSRNKTLSGGGSPKSASSLPSASDIASMSQKDILKLKDKMGDDAFYKHLGWV